MTVLATSVPHTALEQSRIPHWKLLLLHRHALSEAEQPREGAKAIMLFMQVCWRDVSKGPERELSDAECALCSNAEGKREMTGREGEETWGIWMRREDEDGNLHRTVGGC
jgi:hypothetical protein